jgi:hypothetical protein
MLIETIPSKDGGLVLVGGLGPLFLDRLLERAPWKVGHDDWADELEWRLWHRFILLKRARTQDGN